MGAILQDAPTFVQAKGWGERVVVEAAGIEADSDKCIVLHVEDAGRRLEDARRPIAATPFKIGRFARYSIAKRGRLRHSGGH